MQRRSALDVLCVVQAFGFCRLCTPAGLSPQRQRSLGGTSGLRIAMTSQSAALLSNHRDWYLAREVGGARLPSPASSPLRASTMSTCTTPQVDARPGGQSPSD